MEQLVSRTDDAGEARFMETHFFKELEPVGHVHRHQLAFDRCRDDHGLRAFGGGFGEHFFRKGVAVRGAAFIDVADI